MTKEINISIEQYENLKRELEDLKAKMALTQRRLANIEISLASEHDSSLELEVSKIFSGISVYVSRNPSLGRAAARVFEQLIKPDDKNVGVGLSGGRTIQSLVENLSHEYSNLTIHALSCPGLPQDVGFSVNTNVGYFCMKHNKAKGYHIPVDPLVAGSLSNDEMKKIREDMLKNADMIQYAFTGIGTTEVLERLVERVNNNITLKDYKVVGDMLYRPLTEDGKIAHIPHLDERIVGLKPEDLKERLNSHVTHPIRYIVGVASGEQKAEAVYAACIGGFVNYLVIDSLLAKKLIAMANEKKLSK